VLYAESEVRCFFYAKVLKTYIHTMKYPVLISLMANNPRVIKSGFKMNL